ncbi:MAG: glycosyltransferase family 4 protein [candidate division KSB1 bacterium]|nr:glycosyltransferase family 4 protein [candidate division KSB1 bacterium]
MQICTSPSWGGMEMHVGFLSTHLANRSHTIIPVCSPLSPLERDFQERGFTAQRLKLGGYVHPLGVRRLAQWLDDMKVDLVHSHYSRDLWTIAPALRLANRRVSLVFTKHIGTQKPKRDWLHRAIYRQVDHIVAISEVIRQNVIATHPIRPDRVSVVYQGVDLDQFTPDRADRATARAELGYAPEHIVLGIIARLQVSKGYLEFLQMAQRLVAEMPDVRFLLIGEASRGEAEEAQLILGKIQHWQLESVVRWVGFRRDIPRLLNAMDIFVFPSHAEAFGIVLIEAMAMAKPVIASNSDGVLDIVLDRQTGLLVPPRNVDALTRAARQLVQSQEQRNDLGHRARAHVLKFFTLEQMLNTLESVYHKALTE